MVLVCLLGVLFGVRWLLYTYCLLVGFGYCCYNVICVGVCFTLIVLFCIHSFDCFVV